LGIKGTLPRLPLMCYLSPITCKAESIVKWSTRCHEHDRICESIKPCVEISTWSVVTVDNNGVLLITHTM
jgi:hypothetical protein